MLDTAQSSYDDSIALIDRWHGKGRALYAITPRFAITSTPAQLRDGEALAAQYPDCHVQTHLSENRDEIELTCSLYPEARDYLDVYERYGLLGPKSLFGHSIHLSDRETGGDGGERVGRGLLPDLEPLSRQRPLRRGGLRETRACAGRSRPTWAAAPTTRCCGPSTRATRCWRSAGRSSTPLRSFWWITRGNAEALGLEHEIGTLAPGAEADVVVLDSAATPAMALRMETVQDAGRGALRAAGARGRPAGGGGLCRRGEVGRRRVA